MLRSLASAGALAFAFLVALAAPFAAAQERGEEILGTISRVDGRDLVVTHEDGRQIRISVRPTTEVYFSDSGDRKLFPNPTIDDLRVGMGVRFVYGTGIPDRIVVHFVPAGHVRPGPASTEQVKARIQSIDRRALEIRADVAGSSRTYALEDRRQAVGFRTGDLVTLTLQERDGRQVVTRIESAETVGTIRRIGSGNRSVTIEVAGRDETYDVDDRRLLDDFDEGDRVRFEVEERGDGRRVVTHIRRRGLRDRLD